MLRRSSLSRSREALALLGCTLALIAVLAIPAAAQESPSPARLALTLDVNDPYEWLDAYREIVGTPSPSPKPLVVTITQLTPPRFITLHEPTFESTMGGLRGARSMRVVARGRLAGAAAPSTFPLFVEAYYDTAPNTLVRLDYGLSSFMATLVEVKMEER